MVEGGVTCSCWSRAAAWSCCWRRDESRRCTGALDSPAASQQAEKRGHACMQG